MQISDDQKIEKSVGPHAFRLGAATVNDISQLPPRLREQMMKCLEQAERDEIAFRVGVQELVEGMRLAVEKIRQNPDIVFPISRKGLPHDE